MEDEELRHARRALRGVDPEIDLTRVYAESWARAHRADPTGADPTGADPHGADPTGADPHGASVEILLRDPGSAPRGDRPAVRRGRVLVWAAAAAAAAAALVVSVANLPTPRAVPGGGPVPSTSAPTTSGSGPRPSPSFGSTPSQVVLQAGEAVGAGCGVKTVSTLGDESTDTFTDAGARDIETPQPTSLDQSPLHVLHAAATVAALDLSGAADYDLDDVLALEEADGKSVVRIRFAPPDGVVSGGDVTRIDLLVDTNTWLPHSEETWAESDSGKEYVVHSTFHWATCGGPSPGATDDAGRSR